MGRGAGGAANSDGVTGSGLGTAGATGWTGGIALTAGGSGKGVAEATFRGCEAADDGVIEVGITGADTCTGGVVGRGTLLLDALAAIEGCDGAGAGVAGFGSGTANSGGVTGACSCTAGAGVAGADAAGIAAGAGAGVFSTGAESVARADSLRSFDGRADCGAPLRSASSSSMSRGAVGVAPSCVAPFACLRRRPPRRPRRRLPVPAASAVAVGVVEASPATATFSTGLVGSTSALGAGAGFNAAGRCTSCCGAFADSLRADLASCARGSLAGFEAAGAAGFCGGRGCRCASSLRDLFDLDCEPFDCC